MNRLLFAVVAAVSTMSLVADAVETVVSYVAADSPEQLADGKVKFRYDDSGAVSELRMTPGQGETLVLTGEGLVFSHGAQILSAQGGESRLPGNFTAPGHLVLGVTNLSWKTGTLLPADSYEVLFRNVLLDDITPVSGIIRQKAHSRLVDAAAKPYHIRRSGDTMNVQFQMASESFTQAIHVEFKQIGDDVCGKILKAGYYKDGNWALGYDLFLDPTLTVTHYDIYTSEETHAPTWGYGLVGLTMGPRRDTYEFSGKFLSDEYDTVVATNVSLEELEFLYAACGCSRKVKGMPRSVMYPYHVKSGDGVLSAQFQLLDNTMVKCAKVELRQSGVDVVGRIGYAEYLEGGVLGTDLDPAGVGTGYYVMTEETYTETAYGYSVDLLALRRKSRNRLTVPVTGTYDLTNELRGAGIELKFEPATGVSDAVTVNFNSAANAMTDSAFVVKAGETCPIKSYVLNKFALPQGFTEVYGDAELWLKASTVFADGISYGRSGIVMHPGSRLYHNAASVIRCQNQPVTLDAAELRLRSYTPYLNNVIFRNGARIRPDGANGIQAGHVADICRWLVTGTSASTNDANLTLYAWGRNADGQGMDLTVEVEDVTGDDDADFVMNGSVSVNTTYPNAGLVKDGAGTMLMKGSVASIGHPTRIVAGTMLLGASGITASDYAVSLEGGVLAAAAGTSNGAGAVAVTVDSGIRIGTGASLSLTELSVAEEAVLDIASPSPRTGLVTAALDAATLRRIRVNGKRAIQGADGVLLEDGGLVVVFR